MLPKRPSSIQVIQLMFNRFIKIQTNSLPISSHEEKWHYLDLFLLIGQVFLSDFGILSNYNTFRRKQSILDLMQKLRHIQQITKKYHNHLNKNVSLVKFNQTSQTKLYKAFEQDSVKSRKSCNKVRISIEAEGKMWKNKIFKFDSEQQMGFNDHPILKALQQSIFGRVSRADKKKYIYNMLRGAIYALDKIKPPSLELIKDRSLFFNQSTQSHQKFLLLDLDQTLISTQRLESNVDSSGKRTYRFIYRPYLHQFLEKMSQCYQIYVFTAADKGYAKAIVDKLNRRKPYIKDILHREHCLETKKGKYIKDLRIIKNRSLNDIILIDNLVESFGLQINNGIPILQFTGSSQDQELRLIIPFLQEISKCQDVRPILQTKFKLNNLNRISREDLDTYFLGKI